MGGTGVTIFDEIVPKWEADLSVETGLAASLREVRTYVDQAARAVRSRTRTVRSRNPFAAKMPSTTKIAITTTCVILNGGSDCVGANALSAGTFSKSCTINTKTFR